MAQFTRITGMMQILLFDDMNEKMLGAVRFESTFRLSVLFGKSAS